MCAVFQSNIIVLIFAPISIFLVNLFVFVQVLILEMLRDSVSSNFDLYYILTRLHGWSFFSRLSLPWHFSAQEIGHAWIIWNHVALTFVRKLCEDKIRDGGST